MASRVLIRAAAEEDLEALAWLVYLAGKSHMEKSVYDLMFPGPLDHRLEILRELLAVRPWFHYSMFMVADVDGGPAAALCGYGELETGRPRLSRALAEIGWGRRRVKEVIERLEPFHNVFPPHPRQAWIIEHAATLAEHRREGLITSLFREAMDRGRDRGYRRIELGIFTGNLPAQRAYEKLGFMALDEYRDAGFEEIFGCPGMTRMALDI